MNGLIASLEAIADAVDKGPDLSLDVELSIWQSKLSVILNEPAGRKGLAKHARFWAEKLRAFHV